MIEPLSSQFQCSDVYLNSATVGLACNGSIEAMQADLQKWASGKVNPFEYDAIVNRCRELFASLVGAETGEVLIANQVSTSIGLLAASFTKGTKILAPEGDFASVLFPLMAQQSRGIELTLVPHDQLVESISSKYDWVVCSIAQSSNGKVIEPSQLSRAAKAVGCKILLDGTQSVGWMPVNREDWDVLVCGTYKWLLSPRGTAFAAIKPELYESITPINANWYSGESPWESIYGSPLRLDSSARQYDISPAWLNWVGTLPALELISSIGVEAINKHNVGLANQFCKRMGLSPTDSAIVSVKVDGKEANLMNAGVTASIRDEALRLSFHLYNCEKDVDSVINAIMDF
ncbi:aminotransferase class V-fold PLP-dependent enzyme [Aliikangiella sp. G2MR2-5]|uniref:aminotransferase class V-fold PLP-dependent enzyme n=1 Tax=Aliikangiella sp. G2MR2-5 TaxID=2788943 RepID=UPI0018A9114D|nr:aminotransferase class V-fold PLP-dependent enzyme [Aliikangiella sp. G2MR2-5]